MSMAGATVDGRCRRRKHRTSVGEFLKVIMRRNEQENGKNGSTKLSTFQPWGMSTNQVAGTDRTA